MIWALLVGRDEVAYVAWTRIDYAIHAALYACYVCKRISFFSREDRGKQIQFYEHLANDLLDAFESYELAEAVLRGPWQATGGGWRLDETNRPFLNPKST